MGDEWLVYWSTGKLVAHIKEQRIEIAAFKKHLIEVQEKHRYELARADVLDRENNHAQAEIERLNADNVHIADMSIILYNRAQAWRRCAREWRVSMVIEYSDDKDGLKRRLKTKFHIQRLRRDINKVSKKYSPPHTEKEDPNDNTRG